MIARPRSDLDPPRRLRRGVARATRATRAIGAVAILGVAAWLATACGSTSLGVDACRTIENARCEKTATAECDPAFPGDVASCQRFYQVQCGRGLPEGAREPSQKELDRCVAAIKSSCALAAEPSNAPECALFLGTTPSDAGTDAADAPDAVDAADAADTGPTPPADTGPTPPADTGTSPPADAGPAIDAAGDVSDAG